MRYITLYIRSSMISVVYIYIYIYVCAVYTHYLVHYRHTLCNSPIHKLMNIYVYNYIRRHTYFDHEWAYII